MNTKMENLNVFFFPFFSQGHIIPTLDIAKLFSSRGVKSTIITTPTNVCHFTKAVDRAVQLGQKMFIHVIPFPATESSHPENNDSEVPSDHIIPNFFFSTSELQPELERILDEFRPDCLVADMFFPWATESAGKFGIPRLVFHGMNFFSLCAIHNVTTYQPHSKVVSETEPFVIPSLPHQVKMTRMQLMEHQKSESDNEFTRLWKSMAEADLISYGVIVNSFYDLEPDYADYFRRVLNRAWQIGPVSLHNRDEHKHDHDHDHECIKWLNSRKPKSVIYISFGSMVQFSTSQMNEIASGLENSGHFFIWVIPEGNNEWKPAEFDSFQERIKNRGLILWGWAPQVMILDHESIGGFVTHCGWNSIQEAICAGVPMVTWPVFAEQFYNEVLVKDILKIGVESGSRRWGVSTGGDEEVKRETIAAAVKRVMVGEEAEEIRNRVLQLKAAAVIAVEEGGSSYRNLDDLLQQLSHKQF